MQVEILNKVPSEKQSYLRVATIANKTALHYLYIGNDSRSSQFLSDTFHTGSIVTGYEQAKKVLKAASAGTIDVIILDINYFETELRDFHTFLKSRNLGTIPVIFNRQAGQEIGNCDLLDDVIDLNNWQYDFASKVSFLRKNKEYEATRSIINYKVTPSKSVTKRIFDIAVASFLILLLLPIFLLIAAAIRLESRGPIFYNAKRAGRGFRIFSFYKFRTMVVNADKKMQEMAHLNQYNDAGNGPKFFKISNDPRITKVGKFLRNTSLDELPQLLNVLKGDMSLVGNRPLPLYEAATLTTNEFAERFMAPAGITGLWQIKKRGKADMSTAERISLDISYARKSNLLYDIWIMANTPGALFQKNNV